jgi:hypothetical protein
MTDACEDLAFVTDNKAEPYVVLKAYVEAVDSMVSRCDKCGQVCFISRWEVGLRGIPDTSCASCLAIAAASEAASRLGSEGATGQAVLKGKTFRSLIFLPVDAPGLISVGPSAVFVSIHCPTAVKPGAKIRRLSICENKLAGDGGVGHQSQPGG